MASYVNTVRAIVCSELPAGEGRRGKQFLRFLKTYLLRVIAFISSVIELNLCFYMCLLRINLPNLCPNMNHFDAVDFSECHSEEVISFFWRSVYIKWKHMLTISREYLKNNTNNLFNVKCMYRKVDVTFTHFSWNSAFIICAPIEEYFLMVHMKQ